MSKKDGGDCYFSQFHIESIVFFKISTASNICSSLMTSGGANRILSPWVGFANNPLSRRRRQTSHALISSIKKKLFQNNQ